MGFFEEMALTYYCITSGPFYLYSKANGRPAHIS